MQTYPSKEHAESELEFFGFVLDEKTGIYEAQCADTNSIGEYVPMQARILVLPNHRFFIHMTEAPAA